MNYHPRSTGTLGADGLLTAAGSPQGEASRGRACHQVLIFIRTCSIAAMLVCIFAHIQWLQTRPRLGEGVREELADPRGFRRAQERLSEALQVSYKYRISLVAVQFSTQ